MESGDRGEYAESVLSEGRSLYRDCTLILLLGQGKCREKTHAVLKASTKEDSRVKPTTIAYIILIVFYYKVIKLF